MADVEHSTLTGSDAVHPFALPSGSDPGAIGAYKAWLNPATGVVKIRNASNTSWITPTSVGSVPAGGTTGQILTKDTPTDHDYSWQDAPEGGGVLTDHGSTHEIGSTDPISSLPTTAQKQALTGAGGTPSGSNKYITESHTGLSDAAERIPAGGTTGQVLKKDTNADHDVSWQADATGSGGSSDLEGLSDVDLTSAALDDGLFHDGTQFVNKRFNGRFNDPLAISSSGTIAANTHVEHVDASSAAVTRTLPTAVGRAGKSYKIKKVDTSANLVTIATTSSQTIDSGPTSWNIRYFNEALELISDGSNWHIHAESIDLPLTDLRDVTITSPTTDQVLTYNGTDWVNDDPPAAGGGGGGGEAIVPIWTFAPVPPTNFSWAIGASLEEFSETNTLNRVQVDLTNATQARIVYWQVSPGSASGEMRVQYSTDGGSNWNYLDGSTGPSVATGAAGASVEKVGSWVNIASGAKADVLIRVVGINGGGTSVVTGQIQLQAKFGAGSTTTFDPVTTSQNVDDFLGRSTSTGDAGDLRWSYVNGSWSIWASEIGHPGIHRRITSTATTGWSALRLNGESVFDADETFDVVYIIRPGQADTVTTLRLGLIDNPVAVPVAGIYFERLLTDTNWFGVCKSDAGGFLATRVDMAVAQGTAWTKLRMRRTNSSTIAFSVNGGTEATINTNLPTGQLVPYFSITSTAAATKTLDLDLFSQTITGLTR